MKKYLPWFIGVCMLTISVVAYIMLATVEKPQDKSLTEQYAYAVEGQQMIQPKEVVHSEDYEIEWVDPALESIMRLYLDKPEGPIMHSDVWEIHAVYLRNEYRFSAF